MKALEDLCVHYDSSVRTSEQTIVQFTYGDDGLDPVMMVSNGSPVNFPRLLEQCRALMPEKDEPSITPYQIAELQQVLDTPHFTSKCSHQFIQKIKDFLKQYIIDLESALGSLNLLPPGAPRNDKCKLTRAESELIYNRTRRLTRSQFTTFLETCRKNYLKAVTEPGTAVGALGAQSIGEPGTQMTLKVRKQSIAWKREGKVNDKNNHKYIWLTPYSCICCFLCSLDFPLRRCCKYEHYVGCPSYQGNYQCGQSH